MIESLQMTREVKVGNFTIGRNKRFALIAGPCAIESEEMSIEVAKKNKRNL